MYSKLQNIGYEIIEGGEGRGGERRRKKKERRRGGREERKEGSCWVSVVAPLLPAHDPREAVEAESIAWMNHSLYPAHPTLFPGQVLWGRDLGRKPLVCCCSLTSVL